MLQGRHFETGEELLAAIRDLLDTTEKVTLERVFLEWMERLAKSISISGEYVGGDANRLPNTRYQFMILELCR
jgi:hypothetical protein